MASKEAISNYFIVLCGILIAFITKTGRGEYFSYPTYNDENLSWETIEDESFPDPSFKLRFENNVLPPDFVSNFSHFDLRVGRVMKIIPIDPLFFELKIDLGSGINVTTISGIKRYLSTAKKHKLLFKYVPILLNVKPTKVEGRISQAFLPYARKTTKSTRVELFILPPETEPGDYITVEGYKRRPLAEIDMKTVIFKNISKFIRTDKQKRASFNNIPWIVRDRYFKKKGFVKVLSLKNARLL